jgi:hypothetical protein
MARCRGKKNMCQAVGLTPRPIQTYAILVSTARLEKLVDVGFRCTLPISAERISVGWGPQPEDNIKFELRWLAAFRQTEAHDAGDFVTRDHSPQVDGLFCVTM